MILGVFSFFRIMCLASIEACRERGRTPYFRGHETEEQAWALMDQFFAPGRLPRPSPPIELDELGRMIDVPARFMAPNRHPSRATTPRTPNNFGSRTTPAATPPPARRGWTDPGRASTSGTPSRNPATPTTPATGGLFAASTQRTSAGNRAPRNVGDGSNDVRARDDTPRSFVLAEMAAEMKVMEDRMKREEEKKKKGASSTSNANGKERAVQVPWMHTRDLSGTVLSTQYHFLTDQTIRALISEYQHVGRNRTDIVALFLETFFSPEARIIVEDALHARINFDECLYELTAAGMPGREIFFVLALIKVLDAPL